MRVVTRCRNKRSCVTVIVANAAPRRDSSASSHSMPSTSRWFVGSSRSSRSGWRARARPIATRFFHPPDSNAIGVSGPRPPPAASSASVANTRRSCSCASGLSCAASIPSRMASRTVAPSANCGVWSRNATRSPRRRAIVPRSADAVSARMRSSVDLPAPFGPMRPMRSFSSTVKLTPSKRGRAPKDAVSCCASRRIAMRGRSPYDTGPRFTSRELRRNAPSFDCRLRSRRDDAQEGRGARRRSRGGVRGVWPRRGG